MKPWVHSLPIRKQAERRPLTAAAIKKALKSTNDEHFNFNAKTAATGAAATTSVTAADVAQSAAKPAATPLSSPKPMIRTSSSDADSSLPFRNTASIQRGVTRSNCIDSLDRTNVAAFCIGKCALTYQLHALGLCDGGSEGSSNDLVVILLDMYEQMGDALALQYGGSQMHRQMKRDRVKTVSMAPVLYRTKESTKPKEMFVSLMRHYQNTFVDTGKQDAINLILGLFNPTQHNVEIWEMSSDYYLHNPMSTIHADLQVRQSGLKARSLINYANAEWWKRPIAEYEQTLGQFASAQVVSLSLTPKMSPLSTSRLIRSSPGVTSQHTGASQLTTTTIVTAHSSSAASQLASQIAVVNHTTVAVAVGQTIALSSAAKTNVVDNIVWSRANGTQHFAIKTEHNSRYDTFSFYIFTVFSTSADERFSRSGAGTTRSSNTRNCIF